MADAPPPDVPTSVEGVEGAAPVSSPPIDPERVRRDIAEVTALTATGIEVDGEVQVAESLWVLYGHTTYDSGVVVAEYTDVVEATAVLRAVPREPDHQDGTTP
jgi:hypothetical protein